MFSSSAEVFSWLSRFINYESGLPPAKSFRLDRMEHMAEIAGHPERCAPCVHIAGSKGKGSVTSMTASILEAAGLRTARYMSPHISDFRERISMGGSFFDEQVYCAAGEELADLAENKIPAAKISLFDPANEEGEAPTFFELLTLYFFLCARYGGCDAMVVETGMGGRLDCTNVVDPAVSVITLIELEHMAILGKTISEIAGEKAGIIKAGRPVVLAKQPADALEVFRRKAAEKNSPLFYFPQLAEINNLNVHTGGTDFSLAFHKENNAQEFSVPIPGAIQAENAGLAILALKIFDKNINNDVIRRGLSRARIPARFEKIADNPPVIIDGAHTPESASLCAGTFCSLYGEGGILLFGCAADKDAAAMARLLLPHFSQIIITMPGTFRISAPEKVYSAFASDKTTLVKDTAEAIRKTLELSREKNLPVLCTGSFYLASVVREW
ncbi:MAG: bifunctional folylpolyglutamate synthase/dihydrofolate synthase [Treponema sp.]|jgi:dihydrofolate synthase/folylpolyglutamate synthase|nr:bifunctional folylpolyglutamate synthase/dihydrofolate synthase [Treponema sp.]